MCRFHNRKKYGCNDTFCLACGERWTPYISTPFDAEKQSIKRSSVKKKRQLG